MDLTVRIPHSAARPGKAAIYFPQQVYMRAFNTTMLFNSSEPYPNALADDLATAWTEVMNAKLAQEWRARIDAKRIPKSIRARIQRP